MSGQAVRPLPVRIPMELLALSANQQSPKQEGSMRLLKQPKMPWFTMPVVFLVLMVPCSTRARRYDALA